MQKPVETNPENPVVIDRLESIRFENVVFRHRSATYNAIDGISFDVKTGETIAFVGPSGSGKSTLVKLLVGLYRPGSGGAPVGLPHSLRSGGDGPVHKRLSRAGNTGLIHRLKISGGVT